MFPNILGIDSQYFLAAIGIILFLVLAITRLKKQGMSDKKINNFLIVSIISGMGIVLGMTFFDDLWHAVEEGYFTNFALYVQKDGFFQTLSKFWSYGGMTFLGGLYGCLVFYAISYWFLFKDERHNILYYFNLVVPGFVLAHGFARIGCFMVGCCYGIEADPPFGVTFQVGESNGAHVLPTNLYEAIFLIGLFFVLFFALKKKQTGIYFVSYGIFRFLLEFLRGDSRGMVPFIGNLVSPSQFLCIILFIVGVLLIIFEDKLSLWLKKFNKPIKQIKKANAE